MHKRACQSCRLYISSLVHVYTSGQLDLIMRICLQTVLDQGEAGRRQTRQYNAFEISRFDVCRRRVGDPFH